MAKEPPKYTTSYSNGYVVVRMSVKRLVGEPASQIDDAVEAKLPLEIAEALIPLDPAVKVAQESRRKHLEHQVKETEKTLAFLKESLK